MTLFILKGERSQAVGGAGYAGNRRIVSIPSPPCSRSEWGGGPSEGWWRGREERAAGAPPPRFAWSPSPSPMGRTLRPVPLHPPSPLRGFSDDHKRGVRLVGQPHDRPTRCLRRLPAALHRRGAARAAAFAGVRRFLTRFGSTVSTWQKTPERPRYPPTEAGKVRRLQQCRLKLSVPA